MPARTNLRRITRTARNYVFILFFLKSLVVSVCLSSMRGDCSAGDAQAVRAEEWCIMRRLNISAGVLLARKRVPGINVLQLDVSLSREKWCHVWWGDGAYHPCQTPLLWWHVGLFCCTIIVCVLCLVCVLTPFFLFIELWNIYAIYILEYQVWILQLFRSWYAPRQQSQQPTFTCSRMHSTWYVRQVCPYGYFLRLLTSV